MDKYVVQQPIKAVEDNKIIGYELMYQQDDENYFNTASEENAADTIAGFLMQNNELIFGRTKVFVTVTPSLLFRNAAKIFDRDNIVLQIEDNIVVHPSASRSIAKYYEEGYRFAINHFQFQPAYFKLLEYIDYVKLDIKTMEFSALDNTVRVMRGLGKKSIAMGVSTKADFQLAKELEVDYLEGSYIADNLLTKTKKVEFLQGNFFKLVVAVTQDEPNIEEIEEIISRDVSLSYAILKMVNSAYFSLREKISSIRQAIVLLGIGQLKQWVYLMSFYEENEGNYEEVLKMSFLRATFASVLSEQIKGFSLTKSEAYMMGMFSTLDYLIEVPLEELLQDIPIVEGIKSALIQKDGDAGELYELILYYEKADWKEISNRMNHLGIPSKIVSQLYIDSVEEVNQIWDGLTNSFGND